MYIVSVAEFGVVLFFFNDTATTEIYTLSLHDALPILLALQPRAHDVRPVDVVERARVGAAQVDHRHAVEVVGLDRKSTRLNSSHANISYAVFCLKKKKTTPT